MHDDSTESQYIHVNDCPTERHHEAASEKRESLDQTFMFALIFTYMSTVQ